MRMQVFEYDVDGESRRILVLTEVPESIRLGHSTSEDDWLERTGFAAKFVTTEPVELGMPPAEASHYSAGKAEVKIEPTAEQRAEMDRLAETNLRPFIERIHSDLAALSMLSGNPGFPWDTAEKRAMPPTSSRETFASPANMYVTREGLLAEYKRLAAAMPGSHEIVVGLAKWLGFTVVD